MDNLYFQYNNFKVNLFLTVEFLLTLGNIRISAQVNPPTAVN